MTKNSNMYINTSIWSFFDDIMQEIGVSYEAVSDEYKRNGNHVSNKYLIKSGDFDHQKMTRIFSKYNGSALEYDFNGDVYAGVSLLNAIIKVKNGDIYCILSFQDTIGKDRR